ncbi:MAG: 1,4-dihydroxy-6-naphthoate synthase [Clostridia bacterium]|nr:1,4-dihydroxy-6-naphthoate synthase [Clostridia bacterium]
MEVYNSLYCKIFIDSECDIDFLINKINELVSGQKKLFRTIVTKFGELDVNKNEDFDSGKRSIKPDGFLYSRYYLDVEPNEQIEQEDYITSISKFLQDLWKNGFEAVAACDFEEELPSKG